MTRVRPMLVCCAERKNHLEVEVLRARELVGRPGAKQLPTVSVKLHLLERRICIEKHKTWPQTVRTLEPEFRETFVFMEDHQYVFVTALDSIYLISPAHSLLLFY